MLEITFTGLEETIAAIQQIKEAIESPSYLYENYYQKHYKPLIKQRFDRVKSGTPYASPGRKKPRSGAIAGGAGDKGFAVDSGAFELQVTSYFDASNDGLRLFSDLPYADRLNALLQAKSPYPMGAIFLDERDQAVFGESVGDEIDRIWGE